MILNDRFHTEFLLFIRYHNDSFLLYYSKNVNLAVGKVVGASQTGKESQNVSEEIDFSKMTYTQAKKLEMDTQVSC